MSLVKPQQTLFVGIGLFCSHIGLLLIYMSVPHFFNEPTYRGEKVSGTLLQGEGQRWRSKVTQGQVIIHKENNNL